MQIKPISNITRRIAAFALTVHRKTVLAECTIAEAKVEDASADVERQREVLAYENRRLIQLRAALSIAEDAAEAKWTAATTEFSGDELLGVTKS